MNPSKTECVKGGSVVVPLRFFKRAQAKQAQ